MHFMVVVEFHHSAAPSYERLIRTLEPKILLGLTATPERMDGKNIVELFGGRISAEIRLPEAVEKKLLSPFQYFGVSDETDLSELKWSRGGYDRQALGAVYEHNEKRADYIADCVYRYAADIEDIKGLGFCVSVDHARFMAEIFNRRNIPSIMLSGSSDEKERRKAQSRLVSGEIKFIFAVDLYNEGVDIPEVNMLLFLRPTESLTVFVQQLGRGLRLAPNKDCLTVLDFIGAAHRKYSFESKFQALLGSSDYPLISEVENGFIHAPKGCSIVLEKLAQSYVLNNIRKSIDNRQGIYQRIRSFEEDTGQKLNLENFLEHYQMKPLQIYRYGGFYELVFKAGLRPADLKQLDFSLNTQFYRFIGASSPEWIEMIQKFVTDPDQFVSRNLSLKESRMLDMLFFSLFDKPADSLKTKESKKLFDLLKHNSLWRREMKELMDYQYRHMGTATIPYGDRIPLEIYGSYTRDQLLAAFGVKNPKDLREGVKYLADIKTDIFLITINKDEKEYSPTTMYQDYSISEDLFHWQSQSRTSDTSPTGQRYIHHEQEGSEVLLFVREFKRDPVTNHAVPYTFLGPAVYQSHTGSRPMSIIWKLKHKIPARYLKMTSRPVA